MELRNVTEAVQNKNAGQGCADRITVIFPPGTADRIHNLKHWCISKYIRSVVLNELENEEGGNRQ